MKNIVLGSMGEVTVSFVPAIGETPIIPLYLRQLANLIDNGHAHSSIIEQITNRTRAIIAEIDGDIIGFIIFDSLGELGPRLFGSLYDEEEHPLWIFQEYVAIIHRRKGIYKFMYECFCTYAMSQGSNCMRSLVSNTNAVRIQVSNSMIGRDLLPSESFPGYLLQRHHFKNIESQNN